MNSNKPDLNDALDMLYGTRKALDGILCLLSVTNSEKMDIEQMSQLLQTFSLRLSMCENVMKKAIDAYNAHIAV